MVIICLVTAADASEYRERWGRHLKKPDDRWVLADTWLLNAPGWMPAPGDHGLVFVEHMPYRQNDTARYRTRFRFLWGIDEGPKKRFDIGFEKTNDSDPSVLDEDEKPYIIARWRYEGIGEPITLGLHIATERKHFSTAYLMFRFVGIGVNYDGYEEKGGRARFGGYHIKNKRTDKLFFMAGGDMQLSPWGSRPISLTGDYDGDEYGLGIRYRFSDRMAIDASWRRGGDYYQLDLEDGKRFSRWNFSIRAML